jgi:integral membrane protein
MAIVVGIGLILLVFVGIPLQVWADDHAVVDVVGPVHGFLYIVYLVTAADLVRRVGWPVVRLVWMALAGVIPFGAFVEERRVTRRLSSGRRSSRTPPGGA